jgi:hypothetical protein
VTELSELRTLSMYESRANAVVMPDALTYALGGSGSGQRWRATVMPCNTWRSNSAC